MQPVADVAALFASGLACYREGKLSDSEMLLERLLGRLPAHFDALHLLGVISAQTGRQARAVWLLREAIRHNPAVAAAHRHLGNALQELGRLRAALASDDQALALNPRFREALVNRGAALLGLRLADQALSSFDRAIEMGARDAHVLTLRACALIDLRRPIEALGCCDEALALQADLAAAHVNRAAALYLLGRPTEGLASCDAAIAIRPELAEAHVARGSSLYALRRPEEALRSADAALELRPDDATAHNLRAAILLDLQRPHEALASSTQALALRPAYADAHNNHGVALTELQDLAGAIASFDRAIQAQPDVTDAYFNKGLRYLQMGSFEQAWELYERRPLKDLALASVPSGPTLHPDTDVAGKTVLVYAEQGLGDALQFCRYAPLLAARGARVVLCVHPRLHSMVSTLGPHVEVRTRADPLPEHDYHSPLLSLPRAFRTGVRTIPASIPYLQADPVRVAGWRERLGGGELLVGVCWQGSTDRIDIGRSFPLRYLRDIAAIRGIRLVSLQKGAGIEQLQSLPADMRVLDLGREFDEGANAFLDSAAVMSLTQIVITSDTAIAHLAGALGCAAWVALKRVPDWRWMLDRDDSPWYPTLRLYRQSNPGDWSSVFDRMHKDLLLRLAAHH